MQHHASNLGHEGGEGGGECKSYSSNSYYNNYPISASSVDDIVGKGQQILQLEEVLAIDERHSSRIAKPFGVAFHFVAVQCASSTSAINRNGAIPSRGP